MQHMPKNLRGKGRENPLLLNKMDPLAYHTLALLKWSSSG